MSDTNSYVVDLDKAVSWLDGTLDTLEHLAAILDPRKSPRSRYVTVSEPGHIDPLACEAGGLRIGFLCDLATKMRDADRHLSALQELDDDENGDVRGVIGRVIRHAESLTGDVARITGDRLTPGTWKALTPRQLEAVAGLALPDRVDLWAAREIRHLKYGPARDRLRSVDTGNSIQQVGEFWKICYQGERGHYKVKGNKAIGDLVKLLPVPNRQLTVAEMCGDPEGKLAEDARMGVELETDQAGIRKILNELEDIKTIAADGGWSDSLEEKQSKLEAMLRSFRNDRRMETPLKRAHSTIAARIRTFLKKLAEEMPNLAAHLKAHVRLDFPGFGYYPPRGTPRWKI